MYTIYFLISLNAAADDIFRPILSILIMKKKKNEREIYFAFVLIKERAFCLQVALNHLQYLINNLSACQLVHTAMFYSQVTLKGLLLMIPIV